MQKKPYRTLELPEIISGVLVLLVVLWKAGFESLASGQEEKALFTEGTHLLLCGLVWFNTLAVLTHFLKELTRKAAPSRFLWWQLATGMLASFAFSGGLWGFLPPQSFWISLAMSFMLGAFSCVNIGSIIREWRSQAGRRTHSQWSPAVVFFTSMVSFVLVSSLLLMTPGATYIPISFVDSLFTCSSAISITGLTCVDTASTFTPFGKLVLLADIQLGAMGVMTFTYFVLLMVGKRLAVRDQVAISSLLDQQGVNIIPSLIKAVILITFSAEAIGATMLYFLWLGEPGIPQSHLWFYALFHAVSAFCNAGITLFPDNMATACIATDRLLQATMMLLMLAGTLGFGVYLEALTRFRRRMAGKKNSPRWSTHSWLVWRVTLTIMLVGSLTLAALGAFEPSAHERSADLNFWEGLWNTVGRSAGFNLTDISSYGCVYQLFLCILMFIGGNPAGTGGGVFAPVFAICILEILRVLRGQHDVEMHGRRIARNTVERAMSTIVLSTFWIVLTTMLLILLEPALASSDKGPLRLLFLEISAYTTSGYSICNVSDLSPLSKIVICANMVFGRVGMFTFMLIFIKQKDPSPFRYPETRLPLT